MCSGEYMYTLEVDRFTLTCPDTEMANTKRMPAVMIGHQIARAAKIARIIDVVNCKKNIVVMELYLANCVTDS